MAQIVNKFYEIDELLQYFAGSTATTATTKKYAATGIGTGFAVGDTVLVAGFSNTASNGVKTIAYIHTDASYITVSEAIGADESGVSATFNQTYNGAWQDVSGCTVLIGTIRTSGNCSVYTDWSWDRGVTTEFSESANSITGGTAESMGEIVVIAPYARCRVVNNGADQTVMSIYFGGRDY